MEGILNKRIVSLLQALILIVVLRLCTRMSLFPGNTHRVYGEKDVGLKRTLK